MQRSLQERRGYSLSKTNTPEIDNNELLERIQKLNLLEDNFMTKCFEENVEATELVLRIILSKPDIKVNSIATQYSMKNLKGRSLRLDIYATDSTGKKYNIEVQKANIGAGVKRARYHSSLMDSNILPTGVYFDKLADTYVIFITENDVIGKNKPIYHIERYIRETEEYFGDGSHIIYVNASYKDDSNLGKLMHDFSCINPDDMNYEVLATTVRYYKEDKEGIYIMSGVLEEMITDDRKNTAIRMLEKEKYTCEEIAEVLELPLSVIERLSEKLEEL